MYWEVNQSGTLCILWYSIRVVLGIKEMISKIKINLLDILTSFSMLVLQVRERDNKGEFKILILGIKELGK